MSAVDRAVRCGRRDPNDGTRGWELQGSVGPSVRRLEGLEGHAVRRCDAESVVARPHGVGRRDDRAVRRHDLESGPGGRRRELAAGEAGAADVVDADATGARPLDEALLDDRSAVGEDLPTVRIGAERPGAEPVARVGWPRGSVTAGSVAAAVFGGSKLV